MRNAILLSLCAILSGCATLDASTASSRATAELCQIAVMGSDGWNAYDDAGRIAAESEAIRRGTNCMDHADAIRAEQAARSQAMMTMGAAMLERSGWTNTPQTLLGPKVAPAQPLQAPVTARTTCSAPVGAITNCTTHFSDGSLPVQLTCRQLANGQTHCQ